MKKEFIRPEMSIIVLRDDIMEPVITPGTPGDDFGGAKENKDVIIEQEEILPEDKNIWEDDEE